MEKFIEVTHRTTVTSTFVTAEFLCFCAGCPVQTTTSSVMVCISRKNRWRTPNLSGWMWSKSIRFHLVTGLLQVWIRALRAGGKYSRWGETFSNRFLTIQPESYLFLSTLLTRLFAQPVFTISHADNQQTSLLNIEIKKLSFHWKTPKYGNSMNPYI